jgi:hypothetical protein
MRLVLGLLSAAVLLVMALGHVSKTERPCVKRPPYRTHDASGQDVEP